MTYSSPNQNNSTLEVTCNTMCRGGKIHILSGLGNMSKCVCFVLSRKQFPARNQFMIKRTTITITIKLFIQNDLGGLTHYKYNFGDFFTHLTLSLYAIYSYLYYHVGIFLCMVFNAGSSFTSGNYKLNNRRPNKYH